ncbi:MAG: hypothetical protein ACYC11_02210, partial [Bellilinea sp.]
GNGWIIRPNNYHLGRRVGILPADNGQITTCQDEDRNYGNSPWGAHFGHISLVMGLSRSDSPWIWLVKLKGDFMEMFNHSR